MYHRIIDLVNETKTDGKCTPRHGGIIRITDEEYLRLKEAYVTLR